VPETWNTPAAGTNKLHKSWDADKLGAFAFSLWFKSNSNSLTNQLDIHLILAKREKLVSNGLSNQLGKNRNLAKLTSPRAYMRARIVVAIGVSPLDGRVKKEKKE
jgi:hypothetical protein